MRNFRTQVCAALSLAATSSVSLAQARAWGAAHRDEVIDAAVARRPFHRGLYADYFTRLTYVLDERARQGLARFDELRVARDSKEHFRVAG